MLTRVMLLIPNAALRKRVRQSLAGPNTVADILTGKRHFWERAARRSFDVLIAHESSFSGSPDDNLQVVLDLPDRPSVILLVDDDNTKSHAQYLTAGVSSVLYTGLADQMLAGAIEAEIRRRRGEAESLRVSAAEPTPQLRDFASASTSPAMVSFLDVTERVARTDSSVLIQGETGVGKEHLARAVHGAGQRRGRPFIAVNCGGIPESLMEAELFGHEVGAFTGATRSQRGYFELAHGGTLFLDEIGEMPLHLQVKLLRVLQDRQVRRLGSERQIRVDIRVIAATHRDLATDIRTGRFRADLYYRISVVTLTVPPLRERQQDVPTLVHKAAAQLAPKLGLHAVEVTRPAMQALESYDWPGNIRELFNIVERAILLSENGVIDADCLPPGLACDDTDAPLATLTDEPLPEAWLDKPLPELCKDVTDRVEKAYLDALLTRTRGRIGQTAETAGIQARTLFEKMKRLGLRKEDYR